MGRGEGGRFAFSRFLRFIGDFGQEFDGCVHNRLDAFAVNGADGKSLFEAKCGKFRSAYIGATSIHFIDCDENGFAAATKTDGGFTIERNDTFLHINNQDDDIGRFDGEFDLFEGGPGDDVICLFAAKEAYPTRVNESERSAMPFSFGGNAVPRDAGAIVNDGDAASDDSVEERGFSDVWATDNGYKSRHSAKME